jgi:hypothetical protein
MVAAVGRSGFFGQESNFQVFGDGVAPDQIAGDPAVTAAFQDWDSADDGKRVACAPPQASAQSVSCPDSKHYYCDETDRTCHRRVPAVISRTLLDLYNVQFAKANGLPIIDDLATFIQVHEMHFTIGLGQASGAASLLGDIGQAKRKVEAELVGISPRAVAIGLTFPMAYVRRWNREFGNPNATSSFSSLDVTLGSDAVAGFAQWLQVTLALETEPVFGTSASCPK